MRVYRNMYIVGRVGEVVLHIYMYLNMYFVGVRWVCICTCLCNLGLDWWVGWWVNV